MQFAGTERVRALAEVKTGERVEVVDIVFDTIRELCPTLGIHLGDVFRCRERTSHAVLLMRGDGAQVEVDRFYASFVQVRTVDQTRLAPLAGKVKSVLAS